MTYSSAKFSSMTFLFSAVVCVLSLPDTDNPAAPYDRTKKWHFNWLFSYRCAPIPPDCRRCRRVFFSLKTGLRVVRGSWSERTDNHDHNNTYCTTKVSSHFCYCVSCAAAVEQQVGSILSERNGTRTRKSHRHTTRWRPAVDLINVWFSRKFHSKLRVKLPTMATAVQIRWSE